MMMKDDKKRQAWDCKIGVMDGVEVPIGGDASMRQAVKNAFVQSTGVEPDYCFSGWGATLTESERAIVENRETPREDMRGFKYAQNLIKKLREDHRAPAFYEGAAAAFSDAAEEIAMRTKHD